MNLRAERPVFRLLTAILVTIQIAVGGLAALSHWGEPPATGTSISAPDAQAGVVLHDELRCALCQFASEQAQPLPTYEIAVEAVTDDAGLLPGVFEQARPATDLRPSTRAPPARLS